MTRYDFKAARTRIQELTMLYRLARHGDDDMACWAMAAEIDELEREIAEAHKKAAVASSGSEKIIVMPIIA